MKLQEKHREFAVECFARFMKPSQVAEALIAEFSQDIPKPKPPELPSYEHEKKGVIYKFRKDEYVEMKLGRSTRNNTRKLSDTAKQKAKLD